MFAPKLKLVAFAVLATTALSIEPALAGLQLYLLQSLVLACPRSRSWPAGTGSFERFSVVRATGRREVSRRSWPESHKSANSISIGAQARCISQLQMTSWAMPSFWGNRL